MSSVPEGRAANQPFAVATLRSIQLSYGRVERDQALTSAPPCPATPTVREPCVSSPIGPREPPPRHAPPQPPAEAVQPFASAAARRMAVAGALGGRRPCSIFFRTH